MSLCCPEDIVGASPSKVKWQMVRGDSSSITVLFYENDEKTFLDVSQWTYLSTAYDATNQEFYPLDTDVVEGGVTISVPPEVSSLWGTDGSNRVSELSFDLEITGDDGTVWTPVIGTISVLADFSGGTLS